MWCSAHLLVLPVQGLVFKNLQGVNVLGGQEVVEGTKTLAKFDVYSPVPDGALHHVVRRPLVAGRHLSHVGWAALAGEDKIRHDHPQQQIKVTLKNNKGEGFLIAQTFRTI